MNAETAGSLATSTLEPPYVSKLSTPLAATSSYQGASVLRLMTAYDASAFEGRLVAGGWTARDHFAHLARYQVLFRDRIQRALDTHDPRFAPYRGDDDPDFVPYRQAPLPELLRWFQRDREELVRLVHTLDDEMLERTATHDRYGTLTLHRWLDLFLAHEGHHYYQIMRCISQHSALP